ncbi:MAG TPA: hypothetical protein VFW46_15660 [Stellaceae bacterium]|nr:hypothetical protein [Stellaceae bacterium]
MSASNSAPWTYEVHELSEGYSAIVYDARGNRIGGFDHLDEATARLIAAAPELYEALLGSLTIVSAAAYDRGLSPQATDLMHAHLRRVKAALAKAEGRQ